MLLSQPPLICLLLLIMSPTRVKLQAVDMCRRINEGQLRMRVLVCHVISTQKANFFDECAALCAGNTSCYSINYYNKKRKCELNDKTSFTNPEHMIVEDGSYLDIHRPYSDCSDLFCNLEQVCKMDRVDHTYCKACANPLGMESGKIKDSQVTASSVWASFWDAPRGRLNTDRFWAPGAHPGWLQIEFERTMIVTKVATQGRASDNYWVKSYKLSFSVDAVLWKTYEVNGKEKVFAGQLTVVSHALSPKIRHPRQVRFLVVEFNGYPAMAVEVYGCEE